MVFRPKITKILKIMVFTFFITYVFGDIITTLLGIGKYGEANNLASSFLNYGFTGLLGFLILKVLVFALILAMFLLLADFGYTKTSFYLLLSSSITGIFVCLNNILHFFSYQFFSIFVIVIFAFIPVIAFSEMKVAALEH